MQLWDYVTLRDRDEMPGQCWAWMESAERVCGKPEGRQPHLCDRHAVVAERRRAKALAKERARREKWDRIAVEKLPAARVELDRVEREIRRLDPPAPTTDPAYIAVRRRGPGRLTPERIHKLAELSRRAEALRGTVEAGEAAQRRIGTDAA